MKHRRRLAYECFLSATAKKEYEAWKKSNQKVFDKIEELICDIIENGFLEGKGKPEQLRYYSNPPRFSRRINQADRLVYCPINEGVLNYDYFLR